MVAGFVVLCWANIVGNIISAEKRCNYPGRSRVSRLVYLYRRVWVCVCVYPSKRIHVAVCGPIGTKFGTRMQIHLEKVVGKIKKLPRVTQGEGIVGVLEGQKLKMCEICQMA